MNRKQKIQAAAARLRREGTVPDEAVPLVADLLEAHAEMQVGPSEEGGWPKGWLAVDDAQLKLAEAITGGDESGA